MTGLARAAIRRLRTGVVPSWELQQLSIGYKQVKPNIEKLLDDFGGRGALKPLFVSGEWGTGKTHLLTFIRALAEGSGYATAKIDLNARSRALSHPQRFLPMIGDTIRAASNTGIQEVILRLFQEGSIGPIQTFARSQPSGDFRHAIESLCDEFEAHGAIGMGDHPAWAMLIGADLTWSDDGAKREKALFRIAAIAGLCRTIGYKGLVLVFDEAETIDQLWNVRSRMSAYNVLGRLAEMQALWCIVGITERFRRTLDWDLSSNILSHPNLNPSAVRFLQQWRLKRYEAIEPPAISRTGAFELGRSVAALYQTAYNQISNSAALVERCVEEWMRSPVRNPRRLMRLLIHKLDMIRVLDAHH